MNSQLIVKNIWNLSKIFPLEKIQLQGQELMITVKPKLLLGVLTFCKYHIDYQYNILTCITCVDFPNNKYRFKLVYDLLSIRFNIRLRISTFTHEFCGIGTSVRYGICTVFFLIITPI